MALDATGFAIDRLPSGKRSLGGRTFQQWGEFIHLPFLDERSWWFQGCDPATKHFHRRLIDLLRNERGHLAGPPPGHSMNQYRSIRILRRDQHGIDEPERVVLGTIPNQ